MGWETFKIEKAVEIIRVGEKGNKRDSLGFLRESRIAEAYCEMMGNTGTCKTVPVLVLTDGSSSYLVMHEKTLSFLKEDLVVNDLREKAIEKLSQAERDLFYLDLKLG